MTRFLTTAAIAALLAAPALAEGGKTKVLTILTAPEPQTQLMAMVLTMNAVAAGAEASVLLCGPAGDIALKDAPATATEGQPPKGASPKGLLSKMIAEMSVKAEVCAIYLPGKGADASILMDGVTAASPSAKGAEIADGATQILSF